MNFTILKALLQKELLLMKRNPFIPRVIVAMPLMVMLVVPLVANLDVKNVGIAVVDNDHSELSRRIVADIDACEYLNIVAVCPTHSEGMATIEKGSADVLITIPTDYSRNLTVNPMPAIDLAANGVNATKGSLGAQYSAQSVMGTLSQWQAEQGVEIAPVDISVLNLYNPTLNFRNYMIPALMVMLLILICGFLPALNLVGEKETGTIEAMNVTPIGKFTFVLSKLIPYWLAGILVMCVSMVIGYLVYGLMPQGSLAAILLAAILFSLVMSGLGITIANNSSTLMQSIFLMFAIIMVFQLMSGLFTPVGSMPQWAQYITYVVPPRYFIDIMRSIYLKGTPLSALLPQFGALTAFAVVFCGIAALSYKKQS